MLGPGYNTCNYLEAKWLKFINQFDTELNLSIENLVYKTSLTVGVCVPEFKWCSSNKPLHQNDHIDFQSDHIYSHFSSAPPDSDIIFETTENCCTPNEITYTGSSVHKKLTNVCSHFIRCVCMLMSLLGGREIRV